MGLLGRGEAVVRCCVVIPVTSPAFQKNLAFGQMAESQIARWLKVHGNQILPVYDIEYETGKGPRLFGALHELVAPDLLVFGSKRIFWAECKRKTVFTWHRKSRRWTTGIDIRHWNDYVKVAELTGVPIWLFFLHENLTPDPRDIKMGCPPECPTGLFGNSLEYLRHHVNHKSPARSEGTGWGASGMVYWAAKMLRTHASMDEIRALKNA